MPDPDRALIASRGERNRVRKPEYRLAVASSFPSGENAVPMRGREPFSFVVKVLMFAPDDTSQSVAVPSAQAEANVRPSGEKTTQLTCPSQPVSLCRVRIVAMSKSVTA
jgi:hypothetical protein